MPYGTAKDHSRNPKQKPILTSWDLEEDLKSSFLIISISCESHKASLRKKEQRSFPGYTLSPLCYSQIPGICPAQPFVHL